jgi:hypothetical protein
MKISSAGTDRNYSISLSQAAKNQNGAWRLTGYLALIVASVLTLTITGAPRASANTPSNWSYTVPHTSIEIGWTNDHAWVIADYADVIIQGAGFIAGEICSSVGGEEGPFNPVGEACSRAVEPVVSALVKGHPRLTDHGLWVAFYPWSSPQITKGTW